MRSFRLAKIHFDSVCEHSKLVIGTKNGEMIEKAISKLDEEYEKMEELFHGEVTGKDDDELSNEFVRFEEQYQNAKATLVDALTSFPAPVSPTKFNSTDLATVIAQQTALLTQLSQSQSQSHQMSSDATSNIKLKNLSIPTFSGKYGEWKCFEDMFEATVNRNTALSNVQKFYYLKSLLIDDAASVIRSIPLSNDNYVAAWDMVRRRYNKPFLITRSLIQDCINLDQISPGFLNFRSFSSSVAEIMSSLNAMGEYAQSRDPWVVQLIVSRFDKDTKKAWVDELDLEKEPMICDLLKFLEDRAHSLEIFQNTPRRDAKNPIRLNTGFDSSDCFFCKKGKHAIHKCLEFCALSIPDRTSFISKQFRCFNCFGKGHSIKTCSSTRSCLKCKRKHHTLLHRPSNENITSEKSSISETVPINENSNDVVRLNCLPSESLSFLPTALVKLKDAFGNEIKARALLDTGAQTSFISENLLAKLCLNRKQVHVPIIFLSDTKGIYSKGQVCVAVESFHDSSFSVLVKAYVVPRVIKRYPSTQSSISSSLSKSFSLADPTFDIPSEVDLILSASVFFEVLKTERYLKTTENIFIQNTVLGHIVCSREPKVSDSVYLNCSQLGQDSFSDDKMLERFWSFEEVPTSPILSADDLECEKHFNETSERLDNGQFQVRLPFRISPDRLGDSYKHALRQFYSLEHRLGLNPGLKSDYCKFMLEFEELGHMSLCVLPLSEILSKSNYFIPHHCVSQPGKKIRVVFNASSRSSSGFSLNDLLHSGPALQTDIVTVLTHFRFSRYVCVSDLVKMYRQIKVHPDDQVYQFILWRKSTMEPVKCFKLSTVTYGVTSAPYLALRVIQQLIKDSKSNFPKASSVLLKNRFVDDLFFGSDSLDELRELQVEISDLLNTAGFRLHKWCSNHPDLLNNVSSDDLAIPHLFTFANDTPHLKTLGLSWFPEKDYFTFQYKINELSTVTKRILLSETAKLFDPLGFLSPVVLCFKIIFQETWVLKLDWDSRLPNNLEEAFLKVYRELPLLQSIEIPRYFGSGCLEVHGFADASSKAYAAVIYFRFIDSNQEIVVRLISSKSKLAPIKPTSIPRLELCAAHLLSKLVSSVLSNLELTNYKVFLWSDSTTVLSWIKSLPRNYASFVANRVSFIQELTSSYSWLYIKSEHNPADLASRGVLPSKILDSSLWWSGPPCLRSISSEFCEYDFRPTSEEIKKPAILFLSLDESFINQLSLRFSSFDKLVRVMAYCLRQNWKGNSPNVSVLEYQRSLNVLVRQIQISLFPEEHAALTKKLQIKKSSLLYSLNPIMDSNSIIRVGGRLQNSRMDHQFIHPIILKDCHFLQLLLQKIHTQNFHAGFSLMLTNLRRSYWIISGRRIINSFLHKCVRCKRYLAQTYHPPMGSLPQTRVEPSKPFLNCGVDFAGPFSIRPMVGRGKTTLKAYMALFICFSTKAVHLELIMGLSTQCLIYGLQRFLSRRGECKTIWSDNGRNFVGMSHVFKAMKTEIFRTVNSDEMKDFLLKHLITWKFIPPYTPHMGGLWESNIKSVKAHIFKCFVGAVFSIEEFQTILCQIEHILNSRPLTPLSFDANNVVITPNHFLFTSSDFLLPEFSSESVQLSNKKRFEALQKVLDVFWKRWRFEYIDSMIKRKKWVFGSANPAVGDIVLIKNLFKHKSFWPLGRIVDIFPGNDNVVRVVNVFFQGKKQRESVRNLIPLIVDPDVSTGGVMEKTSEF